MLIRPTIFVHPYYDPCLLTRDVLNGLVCLIDLWNKRDYIYMVQVQATGIGTRQLEQATSNWDNLSQVDRMSLGTILNLASRTGKRTILGTTLMTIYRRTLISLYITSLGWYQTLQVYAISQNTALIYNGSLPVSVEVPKILSVQLAPIAIQSVRGTPTTQIPYMSNLCATSMIIVEVVSYGKKWLTYE